MARTALLVTVLSAALGAAVPEAQAGPPRVATDIPPVHSLVARVMQGIGEPALILPPGVSPHGHAMRPSEAAALAEAELVVWVGPTLTPWLGRALSSLAEGARSLPLAEAGQTVLLEFREGASFGPHAHGGDASEADGSGHDHPADEPHHDAHAHGATTPGGGTGDAGQRPHGAGNGEAGGKAGATDPHAWLDPSNAVSWLGLIAEALAGIDPENAAEYQANAAAAQRELEALSAELAAAVAPLRGRPFVVFHDAYNYFENRFGIEAAGALSIADGSPPGPARVSEIRDLIASSGARCVFAEPQFPADLIDTVTEGTPARVAVLDPVGAALPPGPELYPELLRGLAASLESCLGD